MMGIKETLDKIEDSCEPFRRITFNWTAKGKGFGQLVFYVDETDGKVHCENEMMNRETVRRILCSMADNCILNDE